MQSGMLSGIEVLSMLFFWDNLMLHVREAYTVRFHDHSCSCGKWDKFGIPCQHTLAAITFDGGNQLDYVSNWFKKGTYLKEYEFTINPVRWRIF